MTDGDLHKLGDVLRSAREAKGVDLARVERDTKIRVRYLSALERSEYRDLPGAVYTKGFLRNYGSYLGLDTEYLVDLYRLESSAAAVDRPTVHAPPRPITARRSGAFVITPGAVLAAVLTVGVALFIVYLVTEFVTFVGTPDLRVTDPASDLSGYEGEDYTFLGVTEPNARITAETASRKVEATADSEGLFELSVPLRPGANVVTVVANDPLTGRDSEEVRRTILVGDALSPLPSVADAIVFTAPEEDATVPAGPVEVSGTAPPGSELTITATPTAAAPTSFRVTTLTGEDVPLPATTPPAPEPLIVTAAADGTFTGTLQLAAASWELSVARDGSDPVARSVSVAPPEGLRGTVRIEGAESYLEVDEDQVPLADVSGRIAQPGDEIDLSAEGSLRVRVGNAAAVRLIVNGIDLGVMGGQGAVVEWRITAN